MFWLPKRLRDEIRGRGRNEARWLLRDHGDLAESVLAAKLNRQGLSPELRLRYEHAARELRKLRAARSGSATAIVIYRAERLGLPAPLRWLRHKRWLDRNEQ